MYRYVCNEMTCPQGDSHNVAIPQVEGIYENQEDAEMRYKLCSDNNSDKHNVSYGYGDLVCWFR